MNIYQIKRDPSLVQPNEYAGFIVRARNEDEAEEMIFEEYSMERSDWPEESYEYEFENTLLASGVVGEPSILMVDYKAYTLKELKKLEEDQRMLKALYHSPMNHLPDED